MNEEEIAILVSEFYIRYSFDKRPERVQPPPTYAQVLHLHIRLFHYFDFIRSWGKGGL